MYLLYLDDSGSVTNAGDRHVILAGLAVFERAGHWLGRAMDQQAMTLWPTNPDALEFHGTDIHSGNKHWRALPPSVREEAYRAALGRMAATHNVHLFAAAIHKRAVSPRDAMEVAFEQIASRFDRMLTRMYRAGNTQRGLIIADKSTYVTSLQRLSVEFRRTGHSFGQLHNISEVPLFVDSKATRLIQYADLVAHCYRRYIELGDASRFDLIRHAFDQTGGVVHGLVHEIPAGEPCPCWACQCKAARG